MVNKKEYPQDYFVTLENDQHCLGRITLNLHGYDFAVEVDIVQKESRKIRKHVDTLYKIDNHEDALQLGVQRLAQFLKGHG